MSDQSETTSDPMAEAAAAEESQDRNKESFPFKLFRAVSHSPDSIVEWSRNGGAFCIHSTETMENDVMPRYFPKTKRYPSLVRKLNRWGFRRSRCEAPFFQENEIVFVHPKFQRDNPDLLYSMEYVEKGGSKSFRKEESSAAVAPQREDEVLSANISIPRNPLVATDQRSLIRNLMDARTAVGTTQPQNVPLPAYLGTASTLESLLPTAPLRLSTEILQRLAAVRQQQQATDQLALMLHPCLQAAPSLPNLAALPPIQPQSGLQLPGGLSSRSAGAPLPNDLAFLPHATRMLASAELEHQRLLLLHYLRN